MERFVPASAAGGSAAGDTAILGDPLGALRNAGPSQVGETPGLLGVAAGPIDSAARPARCTCHAGPGHPRKRWSSWARDGGGDMSAPVGLVGGSPPGFAPCGPSSNLSTGSNCRPQPPFPGRELCWDGSSICWRTVPDEERVAPSYSGSELVLLAARRTTKQQLGRSSQAVSMPESQAPVEFSGWRGSSPPVVLIWQGDEGGLGTAARRVVVRAAARSRTAHPPSRKLFHFEAKGDHDRRRARRGQTARFRPPARSTLAHVPCCRISRSLRNAGPRVWVAPDPCGLARPGLAPIESAGLAAFHRDRSALDAARRGRGRGAGRGTGGNEIEEVGDGLDEQRPGRLPRRQRGPQSRPGSSSRTWEKEVQLRANLFRLGLDVRTSQRDGTLC